MYEPTMTKTLQEIVDLIVALNGCENCYDPDTAEFKPWEIVDMLKPFSNAENVAAIIKRRDGDNEDGEVFPKFQVGEDVMQLPGGLILCYPDTNKVWSPAGRSTSKVRIVSSFWINLKDNPWSRPDEDYVGMGYVIQYVNYKDEVSDGKFLVHETHLAKIPSG
jgi:hypothetical protein